MKKTVVGRKVELDCECYLDEATDSFWGYVDHWLEQNNMTRSDIIGTPYLSLDTMNSKYEKSTEYPRLNAEFQTLETDKEFNTRVASVKIKK